MMILLPSQSGLTPTLQLSILLMVGALFHTGCASQGALHGGSHAASTTPTPSGEFETLEAVKASDLFPPDVLTGKDYEILEEVVPDGFTYHYTIDSSFGRFEAYGEDMLQIRVKELQALAELNTISQPAAFGSGVASTVMSPFKFLWNLVTDPKNTVMGVPDGISRAISRIGEMMEGERGALEDTEAEELVGFSLAKRQVAATVGADVYSSNAVLQEKLNEVAWAAYAGGMGSRLLLLPIAGPAGFALMGTSFGATMQELLREQTPEDLRLINRTLLTRMGVNDSTIEGFLVHPWYSPRHETILVHALAEMKEVNHRGRFLQVAIGAQREEEALFFQRLAEMMARYHHSVAPIDEIVLLGDRLILGYTTDHALVATVPLARLLWTRPVADAVEKVMSAWESAPHLVRRVELWITGRLTSEARAQLEAHGFMVHERILDRLLASTLGKEVDDTMALLSPTR